MLSIEVTNPSMSFSYGSDGALTIKMRGAFSEGGCDEVVVTMNPVSALTFMAALAANVVHGQQNVIDNLVLGHCDTCQNHRMTRGDNGRLDHCECVSGWAPRFSSHHFGPHRLEAIQAVSPVTEDGHVFTSGPNIEVKDETC